MFDRQPVLRLSEQAIFDFQDVPVSGDRFSGGCLGLAESRHDPRPAPSRSLRDRYDELQQCHDQLIQCHEELMRQLKFAEQVQRSLLPQVLPALDGVQFAAAFRPTQHLAGDFYNAFRLDRERVGFYLGDVMGHGPAAALLSVYTVLSICTKRIDGRIYEIIEPGAVLARLNDVIRDADFPGMPFVTLVYGVLDIPARSWTYCVAGHPHPLILGADGTSTAIEPTAPLLGVLEVSFTQRTIPLNPGDRLVLYSDGVLSATWPDYGFGLEGLRTALEIRDGRSLQERLDEAMQDVCFDDQPTDDIAILALEVG